MPPEVDVSGWSSSSLVPDNIKVKKSITLKPLPLVLTTTLSWNIESKAFTIKTSCKDSLFRGKVTLDVGAKAIQYRKRLTLPVGPLGRLGQLVLGARLTLDQDTFRVKPSYHVGFEIRQGGAELIPFNTVRLKPRISFGRIGLEACTDIGLQIPKQLIFEFTGNERHVETSLDEERAADAWAVNLDIKELNVVFRL